MSAHVPVMLPEVLDALGSGPDQVVADMTFGAGGYTEAILATGARVLAFDRDPAAIAEGRDHFAGEGRLTLIERPFDALEEEVARHVPGGLDGVVFDLGVSSMQLDGAERGFSFMRDGPLDMRMGEGPSAADFVNEAPQEDIRRVLSVYGEERQAGRLAAAIVRARQQEAISSTGQLAAIAGQPRPQDRIHPATRLFQAVRMLVNDELGQLVRALIGAETSLKSGGRLVCVTFHSLEDRIVKRFLAEVSGQRAGGSRHRPAPEGPPATFSLVRRKAVPVSDAEASANPRARSAKLRWAVRTDAPCMPWDHQRLSALGAPALVFSDLQSRWSSR